MSVFCLLLIVQLSLAGCGTGGGSGGSSLAGSTPTPASASNGVVLNIAAQPTAPAKPAFPLSPTVAVNSGNGLISPPGSPLPSEAECAASVHRSSFEPRPQNNQANQSVPMAQQIADLAPWDANLGQSIQADSLRKQITGNFTGTTDEILQWVACKWGVNPDLVRAEAVIESYWKQSLQGDYTSDQTLCPPGTWDGKGCYQSYGILQIKYYYFKSAWPMNRDDTAFNAEYVYGILRACYEGWTTYLRNATPLAGYAPYHAGDIWGCLGRWYSGTWYNQGAVDYIQEVKTALADKTWLQAGF
jgi:hypothetical protein